MTGDEEAQARAGDEEARYRAVAALDPGAPGALAALLAGLADESWRVRAAVVERLASADPEVVAGPLVGALSSEAGIGARDAASTAVVRIGAPAVPALLGALGATDADLRQAAVHALGLVGDRRAAGPLAAALADADLNVRAAAAEALARVGGPEAGAALRGLLASGDTSLRLAAVEGLSALGVWPDGLEVNALLSDPALRRPALRLLGACDDPAAAAHIAAGLLERSRSAREAALAAVGRQRSRRGLPALAPLAAAVRGCLAGSPTALDACAEALGAEEPWVAMGALTVLGWAGAPRHARPALRLAEDERYRALVEELLASLPQDAELRIAVADALPELGPAARVAGLAALARLGSPASLESLVREASDPESYVQADAVAALGRIADARVISPLAGLLGDEQPAVAGVASAALVELGKAGGPAGAAALAALRARAVTRPSAALYRALGALGGGDDLPALAGGLGAGETARRAAAASALAALAARGVPAAIQAVPGLVEALGDAAWAVRAAAAKALHEVARAEAERGRPPPAGAAERLAAALADPEPAVRAAAAEALGSAGGAAHETTLGRLAEDGGAPAQVVVAALRALAARGAITAERLVRASAHADPEVAKVAVAAAAPLAGPVAQAVIVAAVDSARWDVRRAAALALAARGDRALAPLARRRAGEDPDPLVARAFADAAQALER
ncbi:MAG: HEAT repeat domain-containing protein [Anaeromyxobacter sp.]